jgi:peptide/nickel transport system substrate-binding protein
VITLKHRDPSWKYVPAYEGAIFEAKFQQEHKTTMGRPGVGVQATGAWEVNSFDPTTGLELSANPHWWGGKVNVQHISVKYFADETSAALAMRSGSLDVFFPEDARAFASTSGLKVTGVPSAYIEGYFALNYHMGPFSDVHVRRAVAYAINRGQLIKAIGGYSTPVTTFIPPAQLRTLGSAAQVSAALESLPNYSYNLVKAKAEMARSAYPHGFSTSNDCASFGSFPQICEVLAGQLKKIGINMKVSDADLGKWVAEVYGPKTYPTMFTTVGWPNPDPSGFPSILLGSKNVRAGGLNFANYDPPAVDMLLKESTSDLNPGKRLSLYRQLLTRIANDSAYIPLYLTDYNLALSPKFVWPNFNELGSIGAFPQLIKPA